MQRPTIPFNWPYMSGRELEYIQEAYSNGSLSGDGPFTSKCSQKLENLTSSKRVLLTHSCTAALEMSALILNIGVGDEVIMPSYTFVSTANAFALRGAVPVFVDIRHDTLNIDETQIEAAITKRTKAIVPVHYAGVACNMDPIVAIATKFGIPIIEDAAQGILSSYKNKALGSIGGLGALSFHETKNIMAGEGGALLINLEEYVNRAEVIRQKGTDRSRFMRGENSFYTWQDLGSSYLPGELTAAFLWAQLEVANEITENRRKIWDLYHNKLIELELNGKIRRPIAPDYCQHNAHMYYVLLQDNICRKDVLEKMAANGVMALFHYVPLHSSPAGIKYGRCAGSIEVTEWAANRIVRLPLWNTMSEAEIDRVVYSLKSAL